MNLRLDYVLVVILIAFANTQSRAQNPEPIAIIDKAIKAMGGEEKLRKVEVVTWTMTSNLTQSPGRVKTFTRKETVQGHSHFRTEFDSEADASTIGRIDVFDGEHVWRKSAGKRAFNIGERAGPLWKRHGYLQWVQMMLVDLKGQDHVLELAGEDEVFGRPAVGVRVIGPDGKPFTLFFDNESGLLVKLVTKNVDAQKREILEGRLFSNYKDFSGIKIATSLLITNDGQTKVENLITDFKLLRNVTPGTFDEPK